MSSEDALQAYDFSQSATAREDIPFIRINVHVHGENNFGGAPCKDRVRPEVQAVFIDSPCARHLNTIKFLKSSVWVPYEFRMGFVWVSYGFRKVSKGFVWVSYGFRMSFGKVL